MRSKKVIALLISLTLLVSSVLPGTLAVSVDKAVTNDNFTLAEEAVEEQQDQNEQENICTCGSTDGTVPETTVPETGTAASEQPEAPMEQKPVSTDERYTVSFDLGGGILTARGVDRSVTGGGILTARGVDRSVTAAPGETITLPGAPEKEDRTFTGWLSAKSGETYQAEAAYEVTDDDTLTAQWNMLQVLGVNTEPENSNTLSGMDCVVEAVSETEQESVESAVNTALGGDAVGALNVLAADISFLDESGRSLEPAEGETVPVTLTVPEGQIDEDVAFLVVYHMVEREDGSYYAEPVQYAPRGKGDQKIRFGTTAFSIYAVAAVGKKAGDAGSVEIRTDGTGTVYYEIEEEQSKVFFFQDDNAADYTYHRYTWTVKDNDDTVRAYSTSIYFQDKGSTSDKKNSYQYPWLSLDALRPGVVTLAVDYYCYNGSDWWHPSGTVASGTVEIKLAVTAKENGLAIENHIPENGTLKPVWRDAASNVAPVRYVWTKEFYHTYNQGDDSSEGHRGKGIIDDDAVLEDGSINVAIDAGGIAQEQDSSGNDILCMKIYTCTAYDKDENVLGTATHRVEYGEDVLNGSFEYPKIPSGRTNYAFANGTRQLFWRSTAPGSGAYLGMDVELGNDTTGNPYLTYGGKANDGTQFAELNAEKVGTLYQDVLTAPGATLSWSFGHRSRTNTGANVMYLVIASTKDAQNVTNQAQIEALVQNFQADGVSVSYNGGTYTMWKFEGNPDYWQDHSGSYTVPDGQYATRFFFASASGSTTGNLIDGIHFNEVQQYFIEYYLNGNLQEKLTQASHADLDSIITPAHSGDKALENAVLTSSTINGVNYGGVTLSIKARKTVDAEYEECRNVLRLYYTTGTASVRKIVEIEGWDDLSDEEKAVIWGPDGYTASFKLYDRDQVVATASMTIDLDEYAQKTAVAVFKDAEHPTENFAPKLNHSYRVVEGDSDTANGAAHVYVQETTYDPVAEDGTGGNMKTDGAGTGSCTVKNSYRMVLTTLTIQKKGWETIDENQSFLFDVTGPDGYSKRVVIRGSGSVTIKGLKIGKYTVTEVTGWSWRYTPDSETKLITLKATGENSVTFANTRSSTKWLDGNAYCKNEFKNK